MNLSQFPNTVVALIHDSDKTQPVIHQTKLKPSDIKDGYGAFFTVNGFSGQRIKKNLSHISGVYADFDYVEHMQDLPVDWLGFPPSIVNKTKNGFHVIWLLDTPIEVNGANRDELIEEFEGMNRWIVQNWGADNAAVDIGRLLRVPNTEHRKDPDSPFTITTVHEGGDRYTLDELREAFPPVIKVTNDVVYGELNDDASERIERMLEKPHIKELWDGDVPEDKLSESDSALCCHLAFWLAKDPDAMERAWLQSPLGQREKTQQRSDYRKRTIDHAIALTGDVYTPKVISSNVVQERQDYLNHLADADWGDKDWVRELKQKTANYLRVFHHWVATTYPHLLFENAEDRVWWIYDEEEGVYNELAFSEVRSLVAKLLEDDGLTDRITETFIKTVLVRYRGKYQSRGVSYDDFDNDDTWLHANNGWVNLETLVFEEHTPKRRSRIKSAVAYDAQATCPRYDQFLDEDLRLRKDQIRVIDQFSGLSLTNDITKQKMLTLLGRPGCGKSTLLDAWHYVIGDMMVEKKLTELQGESMRFAGSQFVGKRLCWFDEVDVKKAEMGNSLGTLITGQHISVERKGINGIVTARNTLKCVLTANRLPLTAEVGIYRRLIMIPIEVSFVDDGSQDTEIHNKLKSEASGILNRMIRGLHDLRKMGGFTVIEGHEDLVEEYKASSDTVAEFLDTYFDPGNDEDVVPTSVLHASYQHFTEGNSFTRSITAQRFGQLLRSQPLTRFNHIKSTRTMHERLWTGLRLKDGYRINTSTDLIESVSDVGF